MSRYVIVQTFGEHMKPTGRGTCSRLIFVIAFNLLTADLLVEIEPRFWAEAAAAKKCHYKKRGETFTSFTSHYRPRVSQSLGTELLRLDLEKD